MREIAGDGGSTEREDALRAAVERFDEQPAVAALGPAVAAVREAQRSADPTDTAGPDRVGMATGELARAYRRAHEAMREAGVERCGGLPSAADVPEEPPASEPPELSTGVAGDLALRGEQLVMQTGCLACHRIGDAGNDGPGPNLSDIGSRLDRAQLARVLVDPVAPMPSFRQLPEDDRAALVEFLAQLR